MKNTKRLKSFEELAHAMEVVQSKLTARLGDAYSKPLQWSTPNAGGLAGPPEVNSRFRNLFGRDSGVPLRGWGLNE